ncbi:MAG: sulfatase-like hydrolase/transferase, partial [Planctomycetota bacterium]
MKFFRLVVCSFFLQFLGSTEASSPNVVLIVSDDQGYHDLGCIGDVDIRTPHLDRLASEGVRLTNFYVAWPACTPSRAAFLTGRYPQRNGVYENIRNEAPDYGIKYTDASYQLTFERIGGMDVREILLPELLKKAGYTTGIFGKWDLGSLKRYLPRQRGFDDFYGFTNTGIDFYTHERYGVPSMYRNNEPTQEDRGTYVTDLFKREALRFLSEQHGNEFFLYIPFNAPHSSSSLDPTIRSGVQAPDKYLAMYPIQGPKAVKVARHPKYSPISEFSGEHEKQTKEGRVQGYRAAVTCMDDAIGDVLSFLDEHHLADNTIVIFFSDNGGGGGADNGPLRGKKATTWEGGVRVPCIIRWPAELPAGVINDAFLTSLEIVPTLCAATGASLPDTVLDGYDMLPVLKGEADSPRTSMFWERLSSKSQGARVGDWKWTVMDGNEGIYNLAE